ncbi:MAG: peptidoglycan-binding protein [Pyrinomonadaceae bacterium]|nr:peptidoglycan-binding protein [Pyrinomonadaceae bacterium]
MPNELEEREITRQIAFRITGVFEAPSYSTVQTKDSGIISYGQHQATLVSGTLEIILQRYIEFSDSEISTKIKSFMNRVKAKDRSLKNDSTFIDLLKKAGEESEMITAQDSIFIEKYWNPAIQKAIEENRKSPLAFACFYDTHVQGGLVNCVERTKNKLGNSNADEQKYVKTFLESRRERLLEIANRQMNSNNPITKKNGQMLKSAANHRIGSLLDLANSNNLNLVGEFDINGKKIKGRGTQIPTSTVLERGNESESVGILQDNLIKLGYLTKQQVGSNRGKFGPLTENAVENFQTDLELMKTARFTESDQKIMDVILQGFSKDKNKNEYVTKILQKRLVKLGLMTQAQVDTGFGIFGNKTDAAVRKFQKDNGLLDDGVVGANTFKALFNHDTIQPKETVEEVFSATDGENYVVLKDVLMTKDLEKKVVKLANTYFGITNSKLTITSGYRPPFRQAPAIYNNIKLKGLKTVRDTYKNKKLIDEILAAYKANQNETREKAIAEMQKTIENQGEFPPQLNRK